MTEPLSHADQAQLVAQVYELTLEIETAIQLSDWQRAARLVRERSPMVRAITASQSPSSLELIRRIRSLNRTGLARAHAARSELTAKYLSASAAVKAASQYQRVSRFF